MWERCYIIIFSLHLVDQSSHIASILCCHNIQSKITFMRSHCHNNEFTYTILTFLWFQKTSTSPFSFPFLPLMHSWMLSKKCYILAPPPPRSKLYFPHMTSIWLSLSTIGALIEVLETPFNFAIPLITNLDHNVASIAPSLPSIDAFIKNS